MLDSETGCFEQPNNKISHNFNEEKCISWINLNEFLDFTFLNSWKLYFLITNWTFVNELVGCMCWIGKFSSPNLHEAGLLGRVYSHKFRVFLMVWTWNVFKHLQMQKQEPTSICRTITKVTCSCSCKNSVVDLKIKTWLCISKKINLNILFHTKYIFSVQIL